MAGITIGLSTVAAEEEFRQRAERLLLEHGEETEEVSRQLVAWTVELQVGAIRERVVGEVLALPAVAMVRRLRVELRKERQATEQALAAERENSRKLAEVERLQQERRKAEQLATEVENLKRSAREAAAARQEQEEKSRVLAPLRVEELRLEGRTFRMEFCLIPAGRFLMGSPDFEEGRYKDEGPEHEVTIGRPFYLGRYPVTQAQWEAVMGTNPSQFKGANRPVESVSWNDCQEFNRKLNAQAGEARYRLPSEAEWEYACRAGSKTRYSFGNDETLLADHAWYDKNSRNTTHPVGQKKPNAWGLHDMHGNIYEWCQDHWHGGYIGAPTDGSVWESGGGSNRVFRGGSWSIVARYARAANRYGDEPGGRGVDFGFRLVLPPGQ